MILDIILIGVLAAAAFIGWHRGILKTIWGLAALILTIILSAVIQPYAVNFVKNSELSSQIKGNIQNTIQNSIEGSLNNAYNTGGNSITSADENILSNNEYESILQDYGIGSLYNLPDLYSKDITNSIKNSAEHSINNTVEIIFDKVIRIVTSVILFSLFRFVLGIAYQIIKTTFKLPVLKESNKIAGAAVQVVTVLAIVYVVLAITVLIGTDFTKGSTLCRYMYDNNIILYLLG